MSEGLHQGYDKRDFTSGPPTYTDESFIQKVAEALGAADNQTPKKLLDLMSGPGKLAEGLKRKIPELQITLLDLSEKQLQATQVPSDKVVANAIALPERSLPFADSAFDYIVARYAIKDLTSKQQQEAMQEVRRITKKGGKFVIADMVAPTLQVRNWLIEQHSLKQQFSGRVIEAEGHCCINTEIGWMALLLLAGFEPSLSSRHASYVVTSDWLKGRQITEAQLSKLNEFILDAPQDAKREFNIRQEGDKVMLNYPVVIIRGRKR